MMRPIIYQVPPAAPGGMVATNDPNISGQVNLVWTDNSANETGFTIQRDIDPGFPNPFTIAAGPSTGKMNAANEGTDWGSVQTAIDTPPTNGTYFYRVQAVDNGWAGTLSQTYNGPILGQLVSAWSNVATVGTASNAAVSPSALAFGNVLVNQTSATQTVTISNAPGAGTLGITGVTVTGANPADFVVSANTCTSAVAAGASCTISVAFRPAAMGARSGTLAINSTNPTPLAVTLTGTGIAPVISPSNNAFQFGSITVGTTTTAQVLTISNTGNSPLVFNSLTISGGNAADFAQTGNCPIAGTGIQPGFSCTVNMTFKPTAMGNRSTVLVISSSDPVTPFLNISLSGFGTQSVATVVPTSVAFPLQLVNTSSTAQTVTLSNTGNLAYTINSISLAGTNATDFLLNYTCPIGGAGLAPAASCSISVNFRPTAAGTRAATVAIATTANVNPSPAVTLGGMGTQVNLSPLALTFAPQVVATQSASQSVTLTNTGPSALTVKSIAFAGTNPTDFTQTSNCPIGGTLGSGSSCRATVRFVPTAVGTRTATLTISTSDPGTPVGSVSLTGTGIQAAVTLNPTSFNFGAVTARSTSTPARFTLTNSGSATLTINRISIGGANPQQFAQTNNCGGSLAVAASCTINVTFTPAKAGVAYSATLQISDNAPGSPQTAALTGSGQ